MCQPQAGAIQPVDVRPKKGGSARLVVSVAWPLATVVAKRTQRSCLAAIGISIALMAPATAAEILATKIPPGARCDSACSFLWLAGVRREIDCQARIGLHAPRKSRSGNKIMADYLAEMGAPKEMIDLALQTDLAAVTYVDHAQLVPA